MSSLTAAPEEEQRRVIINDMVDVYLKLPINVLKELRAGAYALEGNCFTYENLMNFFQKQWPDIVERCVTEHAPFLLFAKERFLNPDFLDNINSAEVIAWNFLMEDLAVLEHIPKKDPSLDTRGSAPSDSSLPAESLEWVLKIRHYLR